MATEKKTPALFKPASIKPTPVVDAPSLASLPISSAQCEKALTALLAHVDKVQQGREVTDLLGEGTEKVFLVVGLKKAAKREVHKPIALQLPHPVIDPRASPVTLFVKDPQRTYKDLLTSSHINFVSRVVGLDKLRNKHKTFEAKRLLLKEAELFLVDDRVLVEVGKGLGKMWREAKKQPVPVSLARKDLKAELERAVSATYLQVGTGTSLSIKFGTTSLHSSPELLANLLALIPLLAVRIPQSDWSNIQSLHLKTSTSIALPIYNASLDADGIFAGPSQDELSRIEEKRVAKAVLQAERDVKDAEKEQRRIERSATREGKGREEKKKGEGKKRKAEVDEEEVELTQPIIETSAVAEVAVKKGKKSKKAL